MSIANTILNQEQIYLDARYDLICKILKLFYEYYADTGIISETEVNGDMLNAFVCEYSKEIDEILKQYDENKGE